MHIVGAGPEFGGGRLCRRGWPVSSECGRGREVDARPGGKKEAGFRSSRGVGGEGTSGGHWGIICPMASQAGDVTQLLREWSKGNESVIEELTPLVYRELRRLADGYMRRERPDHTLQPTALIHEDRKSTRLN